MKLKTLASLGALAVLLAACGGDDGGDQAAAPAGNPTGTPTTTASAFSSVDAFIAYVRGLASDETSEPVALPAGTAPTSDTTEPAA